MALNRITRNGPHRLSCLTHVTGHQLAATHRHVRRHPRHIAGQVAHHIEQVCAQNDHVFATAAPVLLPCRVNRQHGPDHAVYEHLLHASYLRQIHALVRHRELYGCRVGCGNHAVSRIQTGRHGFLAVDVATRINAGQHHLLVAVHPARPDGDQIQVLPVQHLPVIRIGVLCTHFGGSLATALFVRIRHGNHVHALCPEATQVKAVAVVSGARSAYRACPVSSGSRHLRPPLRQEYHAQCLVGPLDQVFASCGRLAQRHLVGDHRRYLQSS